MRSEQEIRNWLELTKESIKEAAKLQKPLEPNIPLLQKKTQEITLLWVLSQADAADQVTTTITINNCGKCDHGQVMINFNQAICSHPKRERTSKEAVVSDFYDDDSFCDYKVNWHKPPAWCPLRRGEKYQGE